LKRLSTDLSGLKESPFPRKTGLLPELPKYENIMSLSPPHHKETEKVRHRFTARKIATGIILCVIAAVACGIFSQVALWQASLAIEQRQHVKAEHWLTVSSWTWPRSGEWYYLQSILLRRSSQFEELQDSLKAAFAGGWNVADLERQQTLALAQSDQFAEVSDQWSHLFQNAGSDGPEICKAFVNYSLSRFQIAEASSIIDAWKRDFPDDAEAWFVEGRILIVLQRWADAEGVLQESLRRNPQHQGALNDYSTSLMKQLKFSEAAKSLEQLRSLNPDSAETAAALAHCFIQRGSIEQAQSVLNNAMQKHPEDSALLAENGRLQLAMGNLADAVSCLQRAVEQQPENTELRYSLAQSLRSSGNELESQKHFQLVDEGTKALMQLARLINEVVENPQNTELRFKVASLTWKWKSRKDGEAWLRSVLDYDPENKEAHAMLAEHYASTERPELAELHRKKANGI
jgi:tetratricopeptide (TPR) repeat protein